MSGLKAESEFMLEAVVLSVLGGLIAILVGSGVAVLMPTLAGWATLLPWNAVALAFGVSAGIGILFGIYPARKASRLDPIDAFATSSPERPQHSAGWVLTCAEAAAKLIAQRSSWYAGPA